MPDFMIPLDSSDSGSESDVSSDDSSSAVWLLDRGNASQDIDRNRIAYLLRQGRLATVALRDAGVANAVYLNQDQITQKMRELLELIIQKKDSEDLLDNIYNYFTISEPYFFRGQNLTEQGVKDFFKNQIIIARCENAKDPSGNTYIKDGKGAEFLATIGSIILSKIKLEDISSKKEDGIVNSLKECVRGLEDMRLVSQPRPTSAVNLAGVKKNIVSL